MSTEDYHRIPVPATEIAELLCAGLEVHEENAFAVMTGGGNGCGKTTFLTGVLQDEIKQKGYASRDMSAFYETLLQLSSTGRLFAEFYEVNITGKDLWEKIKKENYPNFDKIESYPLPYLDGDMIAFFLPECRQEKRELGDKFFIREHYYRTQNNFPSVCEAVCEHGHSFVVDSTMSNPQSIIDSSNIISSNGYEVSMAIFYAKPHKVISRALARAENDGREISHSDLIQSQAETPINFWEAVEAARDATKDSFLGLYNNDGDKLELVAYTGKTPELECLNPNGQIEEPSHGKLRTTDWKSYSEFRDSTVGLAF